MKKQYTIIIAAIIILTGAFLFGTPTGRKFVTRKPAPESSKALPAGSPAPQASQTTPAENEEAAEETPTVEIPLEKQQMIGVKIVEVGVRPLQKVIRTVGLIQYDEKRLATVNTKFEGWIERLYADYEGKYVNKGERLAEVYSPELYATQMELINALRWAKKTGPAAGRENAGNTPSSPPGKVENTPPTSPLGKGGDGGVGSVTDMLAADAQTIVSAARQRLKLWDISDEQIKRIEETGSPVRTMTIYSPVTGYIVQKMALQGMKVMPGEKLFDIVDLSTLWVVADIYENELSLVKPGESARISLSYFPEKEFSSRIDFIYPSISSTTRSAKVRFEIPNYNGRLKPQMYSNITVKINLGSKLSIPDDAVLDTGTRQVVFVDHGEGNFEPREVMTGIRAEGFREVTMGLKAGEKVASAATFLIDSEAQLKNVTPLGGHKH